MNGDGHGLVGAHATGARAEHVLEMDKEIVVHDGISHALTSQVEAADVERTATWREGKEGVGNMFRKAGCPSIL